MSIELISLTVLLLALAVAGIAIKILLKPNGTFSGTCASQNLYLNQQGESCSICGAKIGEECKEEN